MDPSGRGPKGRVVDDHAATQHVPSSVSSSALDFSDIDQKQQELRSAVGHRIALLERTLMTRDQEIALLRTQLRKLEEDYKYNYNLIAQRDADLDEAAQQLQSLHVELKAAKEDAIGAQQKIRTLDARNKELQDRLMQQHLAAEAKISDVKRSLEVALSKQQQQVVEHESRFESEKEELQKNYVARIKADEAARTVVIQQAELHLAEKEQIWKRQEQALHDELRQVTSREMNAEREREELRNKMHSAQAEHDQQRMTLETKIRMLESELAHKDGERNSLECRLNDSQAALQTSAKLEGSLRLSAARIQALDLETSRLANELSISQQRCQQLASQREDEVKRFSEECEGVASRYATAMKMRDESIAESDARNHRLQLEITDLKTKLAESVISEERARMEVQMIKERSQESEKSVRLRYAEMEKVKNELSAVREDVFRLESQLSDEKRHSAEVEHKAHAVVERHRRDAEAAMHKLEATVAAANEDTSRLTRELHSSEAARRALESQFSTQFDDRSLHRLVESLRIEKTDLEHKVASLERTNEAIRVQVAAFTSELQNDPVVRGAKEIAEKLADAEKAVAEERSRNDQLRASLRDREEELQRYQREILSVKAESQAVKLIADDAMRQACDTARYTASTSTRVTSVANNHPRGASGGEGDDGDQRIVASDEPLLKEAQLWRLRTQQIEAVLREAVAERDAARRENASCRAAIASLTSEKNSLTDINSLLRTQLKQAYVFPTAGGATSGIVSSRSGTPAAGGAGAATSGETTGNVASAVDRVVKEQNARIAALENELLHHHAQELSEPSTHHHHQRVSAAGLEARKAGSSSVSATTKPSPVLRSSSSTSGHGPVKKVGSVSVRHYGFPG